MPILFCTTSSLVSALVAGDASLLFIGSEKTGQNPGRGGGLQPKNRRSGCARATDRDHRSLSLGVYPVPAQAVAPNLRPATGALGGRADRAGSTGISPLFCRGS